MAPGDERWRSLLSRSGERVEPRPKRQDSCLTAGRDGEERGDREGPVAWPPQNTGDVMRKPIWCILGWHHNVWKTNPDGDRFKQCARCGRDGGILANEGIAGRDTLSRGGISEGG
jgi:hypothetical protein